MRWSSQRQSPANSSMTRNMRGDRASVRVARIVGSSMRRKPIPWRTAIPHEGANLVGDAGALRHQPLAHPMQRLQIQLLGGLGRHKLHRRALHGFGNRFGVIEVVLLSFAIGADIFGRHHLAS